MEEKYVKLKGNYHYVHLYHVITISLADLQVIV